MLFGTVAPKELTEWDRGFSYTGECNVKTIGYVAGYTLKDASNPETVVQMSRRPGIGMDRIYKYGQKLAKYCKEVDHLPNTITIGGRSFPVTIRKRVSSLIHILEPLYECPLP